MNSSAIMLRLGTIVLLSVFAPNLSGATFEILFPYAGPGDVKNVDVSDDGSIVLGSNRGASHEAYLWELGKGVTHQYTVYDGITRTGMSGDGRTILSCGYLCNLAAEDASFDGSVIAGVQGPYAFLNAIGIINGQAINLGKFNGDNASRAWAVSADGNTIVGESYNIRQEGLGYLIHRMEPFRWTADKGMVSLGALPGASRQMGRAWDVSGDGQVIVGASSSPKGRMAAFRWTESTHMQPLHDLTLSDLTSGLSEALAVSSDGKTIVGYFNWSESRTDAFVWDAVNGMRKLSDVLVNQYGLDLNGVRLHSATGVSANGRVIVGWGSRPGQKFVWRADLIPEPFSLVLLLWAVTFCLRIRVRA
jgi:probable HAF family extracellular repeat protein